jgi:hypothetical protein
LVFAPSSANKENSYDPSRNIKASIKHCTVKQGETKISLFKSFQNMAGRYSTALNSNIQLHAAVNSARRK